MRDRLIDGYRAIAVLCVVCAHSFAFRFVPPGLIGHELSRLADPLAEMGVQLFFVISGYIITTLLGKEETATGKISIPAFYIRRFFRILPPLFAYYCAIFIIRFAGVITFDPTTVLHSALFTCNTGLTECQWWVAHTWSLAVEEQFYLLWPPLLLLLPPKWRVHFLIGLLGVLVAGFLILPYHFHSNWISFSCIAIGATYALSPALREWVKRWASYHLWLGAALLFVLDPLLKVKLLLVMTPFLVLFILFAARELRLVVKTLALPPFQAIGLCSYSLYLWQQLFLGQPSGYASKIPLAGLPLVVGLSFFLIERPCARLGHRMSRRVKEGVRSAAPAPVQST